MADTSVAWITAPVAASVVAGLTPVVVAAVHAPQVEAPWQTSAIEVRVVVPVAGVAQALGAGAVRRLTPARAFGAGAVLLANVAGRTRAAHAVADVLLVPAQ